MIIQKKMQFERKYPKNPLKGNLLRVTMFSFVKQPFFKNQPAVMQPSAISRCIPTIFFFFLLSKEIFQLQTNFEATPDHPPPG